MTPSAPFAHATAAEVRRAARCGELTGPTAGMARGFVQANVVVVPVDYAVEFADFCAANAQACPLLGQTSTGSPHLPDVSGDGDLRSDVPRYRVYHDGVADSAQPYDVTTWWHDRLVGFLLGCSFTFEAALLEAGLPIRHIDQGRNVSMYRTDRMCTPAGRFTGPLVVSMRPIRRDRVEEAVAVSACYPRMHGAPVHVGDPAALGIADLGRPDFGDAVDVRADEVPVFWACGVTPQLALAAAAPPLAITHSPGCMYLTDLRDDGVRGLGV
ncbi:MAG: putative hydro-lyase [Pirellulales bacterium]